MQLSEIEQRYILNETSNQQYYLVNLICEKNKEGILGELPALFIDNDFVADAFKKMKDIKIKKVDIHSVEILEPEKSVQLYGARAKYGFIHIRTYGWKKPLP